MITRLSEISGKPVNILSGMHFNIVFLLIPVLIFGISRKLPAQDYYIYVAAESEDKVYQVKYDADSKKGSVVNKTEVGIFPTEMEGPHGINISPDGDHWFVSVAHGNPYGWLYKYTTGDNEFVAKTELGMFPATLEISQVTGLLYVVNFNLHGDHEPSTVSVVDPESMIEVAKIPTGIMPHGSRVSSDGKRQYHVSMMTDELVEINTVTLEVSRRLRLSRDESADTSSIEASAENGHTSHKRSIKNPVVKPTWADPHPNKPFVYVAGNGSDEILEINTKSWKITRRFDAGKNNAPYNLEVSQNGSLLVATYKGTGTTGIWNIDSGKELTVIENSRKVTHGVTISSDSKFAFISVEGIGGEPGSVDVVDLQNRILTGVIEVGKQAGGIIFWKKD